MKERENKERKKKRSTWQTEQMIILWIWKQEKKDHFGLVCWLIEESHIGEEKDQFFYHSRGVECIGIGHQLKTRS